MIGNLIASNLCYAQITIDPPGIEAGFKYEFLNNNYDNWYEIYLSGERFLIPEKTIVYGKLRQTNRFNLSDEEVLLGFFTILDQEQQWGIGVEGTFSHSHHVLPEWSVEGSVKNSFTKNWTIEVGLNHTEYTNAEFNQEFLRVEYGDDLQIAYTLELTQVLNVGDGATHIVELQYYYDPETDSNIALSFLIGEIVEDQSDFVLRNDVQALILEGKHLFSQNWGVTYGFIFWNNGEQYTRTGGQLGVRYQF
ncbi:MAG: YaiO family outer membrane beta-barrel protein [Leptolyngbya sp. SIO1D8]|nr:YaiO family outer membrane beta-barrel protein [Leptolyngbya sp. SIO1D8]